jgi:hypothetical protein
VGGLEACRRGRPGGALGCGRIPGGKMAASEPERTFGGSGPLDEKGAGSEGTHPCSESLWIWLYVGLFAGPSDPKIGKYQGGWPTMKCALDRSYNLTRGSGC